MYYADLSFEGVFGDYSLLTVGWLEPEYPYHTGLMPQHLLAKLKRLILAQPGIELMRGIHTCRLGDGQYNVWLVLVEDVEEVLMHDHSQPSIRQTPDESQKISQLLGHSSVWLPGLNNIIYAAPTLIYHYITAHAYLPPPEYLEALAAYDFDSGLDCQKLYDDFMASWRNEIMAKKQEQAKDEAADDLP